MEGKTIGIIAIVIIVILGGWFLLSGTPAKAPTTTDQTSTVTDTTTTTTTSMPVPEVTVAYTDQGFSPKSVTVAQGTTVTFVNQSTKKMWVASAPHPTHQGYDGTTASQHCVAGYSGSTPFDACSAGTAYSFIFTKAGTWGYHNHNSAGDKGTIIVTSSTL